MTVKKVIKYTKTQCKKRKKIHSLRTIRTDRDTHIIIHSEP